MKYFFSKFGIIVAGILFTKTAIAQYMEIDLETGWEFSKANENTWYPATVPGSVHTDLLNNQLIPDPFYGTNEAEVQWVEAEDWVYRKQFHLSHKFLGQTFCYLELDGLDTYADVYVNDSLVLTVDNMFRSHKLDVKSYLHTGANEIRIYFHSPVTRAKLLQAEYPIQLPTDERVFVRKAQYQFGWDWGPRLVTSGIWKEIRLVAYNNLYVKSAYFTYNDNTETDTAKININLEFLAKNRMRYDITIVEMNSGIVCYKQSFVNVLPTITDIGFDYRIPERWMPVGYGNQPIYQFRVLIKHNKQVYYDQIFKTGFSNIKLNREQDASGESFYFTADGKPVFIKGANIIPLHSFPGTLTDADYRKLLLEAKNMQINMIRVWGGGIYEKDIFYDLCDSLGILVWQDFMYACAMYPKNIKSELEYSNQIERLIRHPCIALWCGNNEIDEAWNNWGWQNQYKWGEADALSIERINQEIFYQNIPDALDQDRSAFGTPNYHPSSPKHGWGRKESLTEGDAHYWGVWWGKQPFSVYNTKVPRFMSEYGFQGMPPYTALKQFIPADQLYLGSPALKQHQKHPTGFETIETYMERDYLIPTNLEDYAYVSQLLQADGMHTAIEAHRRNMPYCMGTMFWQLNDCWPVTSWSVLDYYGNRKAAYYTVKNTYADVIISMWQLENQLSVYVVNDRSMPIDGTLQYALMRVDGTILNSGSTGLQVEAFTSFPYTTLSLDWLLSGYNPAETILSVQVYDRDKHLIATRIHLFVSPNKFQLQKPEFDITVDDSTRTITITSPTFAKGVYLYTEAAELKLTDNYFDLLPNTPKQISLQEIPEAGIPNADAIRVKSLYSIINSK